MNEQSENKNTETVNESVKDAKDTVTERFEVASNQLAERVQELIRQGNIRRIIVRTADDRVLLDTPLTVGAVGIGALTLVGGLPLAAIGVIAGVLAKLKVEVVREITDEDEVVEVKRKKVKIAVEDEE